MAGKGSVARRLRNSLLAAATVAGTTAATVGAVSAVSGAASTPTVSAVSPPTGPIAGASVVAVTGTNFTGVTGVSVGSTALTSTQYDVVSATRIDLVTPAVTAAAPVDITVTNGSGTSATSPADQFTYTTDPVPDCQASLSATDNLCEEASGGSLTVTAGSIVLPFAGFGNSALGSLDLSTGQFSVPASSVAFPNEVGTLQSITAEVTISANGPLTGSFNLQSGAASTTANLNLGLYVPLLGDFCVAQISFTASGTIASYTTSSPGVVDSSGTLNASGPLSLATNDNGNGCALANQLLNNASQQAVLPFNAYLYAPTSVPAPPDAVAAPPVVTSLSPASGPAAGGSTVTVTGSGFGTASGGTFTPTVTGVSVGSTALTSSQYDVVSPTQIDLVTPAGTTGTVDVTVTNPQGTSPSSAADHFTYQSSAPSCDGSSLTAATNLCVDASSGSLSIQTAGGTALQTAGFGMAALGSVDLGTGAIDIPATGLQFPQLTTSLLGTTVPMTLSGGSALTGTLSLSGGTASASGTVDIGIYVPPLGTFCVIHQPLATTGTIGTLGAGAQPGVLQASGTLSTTGSVSAGANDSGNGCGLVEQLMHNATDSVTIPYTAYEYNAPQPSLTGITPNHGPQAGGTAVTLTGSHLTGATGVSFGSTPATGVTVVSDTEVTATTPAGTGTAQVTVTAPGGTSNAEAYTYDAPAPVLASISPASGPAAGGTTVTLTGTNLSGATSVAFGASPATGVTVVSDTEVTATAPAGSGTVQVTVTTPAGTSNGEAYTYTVPAPALTAIAPASGSTTGGTTVTLTGTDLSGATGVSFGSTPASSFTAVSDTEVTATAPAGSGTVQVTVTTPGGTSNGEAYTYTVPAPTLTALAPAHGPTAGGTTVTLTGTNLSGASGVAFGSTPATGVTVVSDTEVTATAPAGTGSVQVTVTTPGGTSNGEAYTYDAPTLSAVSPASGPAAGGTTVTLTGTNLRGATSVAFGANAATNLTVVTPDTELSVTAPAGSGTVQVTVTTPGGTSNGEAYTYTVPAPALTAIAPASGSTAGGTTVTLTGTDLSGATGVSFGSTPASSFTAVSDTEVTATAPAGSGTVQVTVTTPGGTSNGEAYTYTVSAPSLTAISPGHGPAVGGTAVTLVGSHLSGASGVAFGSTPATNVTVVSDTQVTATAPAGTGTVQVTVTTPGGTSNGETYSYDAPALLSASPTGGPAAGGTTVTLTGTNLSGATGVSFGANAATNVTVVSDTEVTATAPAGTGTVQVTVTTPSGTSNGLAYAYQTCAAPLESISPSSGPEAGGNTVTLTGCGLSGATGVSFGANAATNVTVVSDTEVTATAPAGTGTVQVTVTTPSGTSNGLAYTYAATPLPVVAGISPQSGTACGGPATVTITGTNLGSPTAVDFGTTPATGVSANAAGTEVTATAPPGTGTVDVTVTTAAGTSATSPADQFTYLTPPPAVAEISPTSGPGSGGTLVTITVPCVDLSQTAGVLFGTEPAATYTVVNASTVTAVSPAGSGPVDVTVVTPNGFSAIGASDVFTYVSGTTPAVGAVAPGLGSSAGGTAVSIYGSGLTGATAVHFGTVAAPSFTVVDDNLITATAPPGSGEVHVTVTTPTGTSSTSAHDQFGYVPAPQVLFVLPNAAPANSGYHLAFLFGRGLSGVTAVSFGSQPAPFLDLSSVVVLAFAPSEGPGTVDVRVTTRFGGTSAAVPTDRFTYTGAPAAS